jgi:hypothetical protein
MEIMETEQFICDFTGPHDIDRCKKYIKEKEKEGWKKGTKLTLSSDKTKLIITMIKVIPLE